MKPYSAMFIGMAQLLLACSGAPESAESEGADGVNHRQQAGYGLQGYGLQGYGLQGYGLQGTATSLATVQQVDIGGTPVTNIQLQGTLLTGSLGATSISGTDFIGATVTQLAPDGSTFTSTIANVQSDPQDASGEVLLYTLTAYNPNTGLVENICNPDPSGQSWATPVYGSWDSAGARINSTTQFMFACTSGVVAKCIRWGYRPWKSINGVSLADYHQACTRMARADYCGDGVSHTRDATLIDMYDLLQIQVQTPPDLTNPLVFDAAWTPQGAYCMTKDRWLVVSQLLSVTTQCKTKFIDLFPLVTTSPVNALDICAVKRTDVSRSSVLMDNKSALNLALF